MEVERIRDYYNSTYGAHLILLYTLYYYYIVVPLLIILLRVRRTSMHTVAVVHILRHRHRYPRYIILRYICTSIFCKFRIFAQYHILHVYNVHNILYAPNPGLNKIIIIRTGDRELYNKRLRNTYYEYATYEHWLNILI